jgi:hypothetical protein
VLCCAVLCCAVLCCAVLCCAVLCCVVVVPNTGSSCHVQVKCLRVASARSRPFSVISPRRHSWARFVGYSALLPSVSVRCDSHCSPVSTRADVGVAVPTQGSGAVANECATDVQRARRCGQRCQGQRARVCVGVFVRMRGRWRVTVVVTQHSFTHARTCLTVLWLLQGHVLLSLPSVSSESISSTSDASSSPYVMCRSRQPACGPCFPPCMCFPFKLSSFHPLSICMLVCALAAVRRTQCFAGKACACASGCVCKRSGACVRVPGRTPSA